MKKSDDKGTMPGIEDVSVDVVIPNFAMGLRDAADFLYELGHRRFAFLDARSQGQRVGERPGFFRKMIAEFGDAETEAVGCEPSVVEACEAAHRILAHESRPSAVVALNDLTAIGVMRAANDLGLKVPEDVSVVGIDGIPLEEQLKISLSTVVQPHFEMASSGGVFD